MKIKPEEHPDRLPSNHEDADTQKTIRAAISAALSRKDKRYE